MKNTCTQLLINSSRNGVGHLSCCELICWPMIIHMVLGLSSVLKVSSHVFALMIIGETQKCTTYWQYMYMYIHMCGICTLISALFLSLNMCQSCIVCIRVVVKESLTHSLFATYIVCIAVHPPGSVILQWPTASHHQDGTPSHRYCRGKDSTYPRMRSTARLQLLSWSRADRTLKRRVTFSTSAAAAG